MGGRSTSAKNMNNRDPATGRFLPGNSGGGRKPLPEDIREKLQDAGPEAVDTLLAVMRDKKARAADRIRAAEIVLNHGFGKPRQAIELESTTKEGSGIVFLPMRMDEAEDELRRAGCKIKVTDTTQSKRPSERKKTAL